MGGGGAGGIGQDEAEEKEEEKKVSVNQASAYTEESTHREFVCFLFLFLNLCSDR